MKMKIKKAKTTSSVFDKNKMLLSEHSEFSIKEAFKTLRTNVMFSLPGKESKCIGIVSANRGEGKSSVALNLGISFAQIGKKVIVIDCDLRLPTIATKLDIDAKPGLSNFLSGNSDMSDELIKHSNEYGIDIITSGDIPPDSTTLIGSKHMERMIEMLKKYYDYIILDFPPITLVTDAVLLAHLVDGYLLIIKHNSSEMQRISGMLRQLDFAGAKVIGYVYNGKNNHEKYYRGKGGYYYYNNYYYYKSHKSKSN